MVVPSGVLVAVFACCAFGVYFLVYLQISDVLGAIGVSLWRFSRVLRCSPLGFRRALLSSFVILVLSEGAPSGIWSWYARFPPLGFFLWLVLLGSSFGYSLDSCSGFFLGFSLGISWVYSWVVVLRVVFFGFSVHWFFPCIAVFCGNFVLRQCVQSFWTAENMGLLAVLNFTLCAFVVAVGVPRVFAACT